MPQRRDLTQNERQLLATCWLVRPNVKLRQSLTLTRASSADCGSCTWTLEMYNGDKVKVVCGLQLTHRPDVCHLWHGVDGSTPQLRLVGTLNRRMVTGSLLKPSGTDFMQRTCGLEDLLCVRP